jgi:hypothetical protein
VNAIRKDLVRRKDSETTGQRWRVETGRPLYRPRRLRLNRSSAFDLLLRPLITLGCGRLRADPKTKHALFAVCTATDIDEFEDFASEVDLFLSKPITKGDVDELLNRLAARRATMVFGSEENVP